MNVKFQLYYNNKLIRIKLVEQKEHKLINKASRI